jgi:predicted TIM-barrel fold metal-dependent hydrolase
MGSSNVGTDERYLVISADMHAGNHLLGYRDHLEARWLDEFDAWAASANSRWDAIEVGDDPRRCRWESDLRLDVLEADGICAELIFPDTVPPFFPSSAVFANQPRDRDDYERRLAGIRAHNRWAVDFCAEVPGRRQAPVQIFLFDIDDALADIRWGHEQGMPAVLVPAVAPNHPLDGLWSKRYDPIWALCQELGMPVNQHVGAGTPDLGFDPAEGAALLYEVFFYARRSFWHMVFGGVFERFPDLRFVMTEEGLAWTVDELRRLDHYYGNVTGHPDLDQSRFGLQALQHLTMPPSGYFHRNCWIGASAMPPSEVGALATVSPDRVMWGADYPHPEGTTPFTTAALRATFADVPHDLCRRILAENAAELYGFDLDALAPVARRIGPRVDEVHTPLDEYPDGSLLPIYMGSLRPEPGDHNGFTGHVQAVART